jgi:hypothetical protein
MMYFLLAGLVSTCALLAQSDPGEASLGGHVLDSVTSAPIRKATVILTTPQVTTRQIRLVADTDAAGKFQFTGLPPGTYRLSASHAGFFDHPARRPVPLAATGQVTDAEIRLPPQSAIAGHILDEDGDPVGGARVYIFKQVYRDGTKQWERLNTASLASETGEYRFPGLTIGRYLLQAENLRPEVDNRFGASDKPKMVYVRTYYQNAPGQPAAVPVDVGVGAEVRGIDIHLIQVVRPPIAPSVHVRGKVIGVHPDSQIVVGVSLQGERFSANTVASPPDYGFDLSAPPGEYKVFGNVYSGGPEAYARPEAVMVTGDVTGVMLTMNPPAYVTGRVSIAETDSKVSLQGVTVSLRRQGENNVPSARSLATGKFVFEKPLQPGHFTMNINARSIPDNCFVQKVKLGGQEVSADDLEIPASAQLEIVLSNTAGKITGSVLDDDGKAFPISSVTLIPADGRSRPVKQSVDDDGNFQLTGLRPGKYKLFAWEEVDEDLWQDPEFRKNYESRATEITVGPSETQNAQLRVIAVEAMK